MTRRLTHEEYVNRVEKIHNYNIEIVGRYVNSRTRINAYCKICKYKWNPKAGALIERNATNCPECSNKQKAQKLEKIKREKFVNLKNSFKERVKNQYGDRYKILGEYINAKTDVELYCKVHGKFFKTPDKLLRGQGCPRCGYKRLGEKLRKTHKEFEEEFYLIHNIDEYIIKSKYIRYKDIIKIGHLLCGEEWKTTPASVLQGSGCPKCNPSSPKTTREFKDQVYVICGNEYGVIGSYVNCYTHIEMFHRKCKRGYLVTPNAFLQGSRCPHCSDINNSKGTIKIENYLKEKQMSYTREHKEENCRNATHLPFDFMIFDPFMLIEHDGQQHFSPIEFWGGVERFKKTKENDQIKNNYCIQNNIPLIRIPYWEFDNIENILDHVLGYYKLIEKSDVDKELVHKFLVNHPDWSHEKYIAQAP